MYLERELVVSSLFLSMNMAILRTSRIIQENTDKKTEVGSPTPAQFSCYVPTIIDESLRLLSLQRPQF